MLKIAGIEPSSIVDGPGFRYTVFFQGCSHHCDGCHNPATWDMDGGRTQDIDSLIADIKTNKYLDGVTISGGEPFDQPQGLLELLKRLSDYNVIVFTGYTFEELMSSPDKKECLPYIYVIVDGRYIKEQRTLTLRFRGSKNQRVIDVKKSLKENALILIDWDKE